MEPGGSSQYVVLMNLFQAITSSIFKTHFNITIFIYAQFF
jgi:hypothetical protein